MIIVCSYFEQTVRRGEEAAFYPVVDMGSSEPYPMFVPAGSGVGVIFVPFSREEQQHGSGFYVCLRTGPAGKIAFSSRNVNQLIFVEGAFAFVLEIVVIRVFRQRVGMIRRNVLIAYRRNDDTPFFVPSIYSQVF